MTLLAKLIFRLVQGSLPEGTGFEEIEIPSFLKQTFHPRFGEISKTALVTFSFNPLALTQLLCEACAT